MFLSSLKRALAFLGRRVTIPACFCSGDRWPPLGLRLCKREIIWQSDRVSFKLLTTPHALIYRAKSHYRTRESSLRWPTRSQTSVSPMLCILLSFISITLNFFLSNQSFVFVSWYTAIKSVPSGAADVFRVFDCYANVSSFVTTCNFYY